MTIIPPWLARLGTGTNMAILAYGSMPLVVGDRTSSLALRVGSGELIFFHVLVICSFIAFARNCSTRPGKKQTPEKNRKVDGESESGSGQTPEGGNGQRWCPKCERPKAPRTHHCKVCRVCVPKMDHHCPWTATCVGYTTFPHFLRFIFYGVFAMGMVEVWMVRRVWGLWTLRNVSAAYGPSGTTLAYLFFLLLDNSITVFMIGILLVRSVWGLFVNTTMIEGWEINRHSALLRRAKLRGGYVNGPGGVKVVVRRQEFPYDIGFWKNIKQGMGNVWFWWWPFAPTPNIDEARDWETNGFSDLPWPPPDPERMPRRVEPTGQTKLGDGPGISSEAVEAFRARQAADLQRWDVEGSGSDGTTSDTDPDEVEDEVWTDSEGQRLDDFGVDEETELTEAGISIRHRRPPTSTSPDASHSRDAW